MGLVDILVFVVFIAAVIGIGLWKSKDETGGEVDAQDYFLAGRGLTWWLVGFSLIAANISTEQFVGMSGKAADWLGMAIASYEWMAAVTLVVVAFVFLPKFLKSGIYTIPEFLEYRYNTFARTVMAIATLVILVGVPTASVIFSGAKVITGNFQGQEFLGWDLGNVTVGCWIIGTLAAVYVFAGGLKACAWADLLQGAALVIGGVVITWFAMSLLEESDPAELIKTARNSEVTVESLAEAGAVDRFFALNSGELPDGKLHMVRGKEDPEIPWTALLVGLWIPNFFYWGLNQYITQRTLGSKSLAEGQKGVVFAAFLKLIIPFVVVVPGILAYNLFSEELKSDAINRNAQIISEKSPELYSALSDASKPDAELERNANILEKIEANLAQESAAELAYVYGFEEDFASLYPDYAGSVIQHNLSVVGSDFESEFSADTQDASEMAALSAEILKEVESRGEEAKIASETLVAHDFDNAFPTLIRKLLPSGNGIKGFVLAAIFGAVVSSLASMLNSASTIATMDIYHKINPAAEQSQLVKMGRAFVIIFVLIAMAIAPELGRPEFGGIFTFIQEFQGFISPGVLAIFLFGLLVHRAPRSVGTIGLILNPILYGLFKFSPTLFGESNPGFLVWAAGLSFLDRMALCFGILIVVLGAITAMKPLDKPIDLPVNESMDLTSSAGAKFWGYVVVALTAVLYWIFF